MSISLTALLALVCIVVAFFLGVFGGSFVFSPLVWLIAAIAFNTLGVGVTIGRKE